MDDQHAVVADLCNQIQVLRRRIAELEAQLAEREAQCGEVRAALEAVDGLDFFHGDEDPTWQDACCYIANRVRTITWDVLQKTDVGKGWVSPEEFDAIAARVAENTKPLVEELKTQLDQARAEAAAAVRAMESAWAGMWDGNLSGEGVEVGYAQAVDKEVRAVRDGTAGKSLLNELEKLRAVAEAAREFVTAELSDSPLGGDSRIETVRKALDALKENP